MLEQNGVIEWWMSWECENIKTWSTRNSQFITSFSRFLSETHTHKMIIITIFFIATLHIIIIIIERNWCVCVFDSNVMRSLFFFFLRIVEKHSCVFYVFTSLSIHFPCFLPSPSSQERERVKIQFPTTLRFPSYDERVRIYKFVRIESRV